MNGKDWNKNDTSYYAVYYTEDDGNFWRWIDVVTINFGEWLKRENKSTEKGGVNEDQEPFDAHDFWLDEIEVFLREQSR